MREALSLLTWVAAFVVAYTCFIRQILPPAGGFHRNPIVARLLAGFVILFVAALILGSLLSTLLATLVKATGFDRYGPRAGYGLWPVPRRAAGCGDNRRVLKMTRSPLTLGGRITN